MKFIDESTNKEVDVIIHCKKMMLKHSGKWDDLKVYIGTDSQNRRRNTVFATVIVFRFGNRGAHFIYKREKVKRIPDKKRFMRLWDEVERSLAVARLLRDNDIPVFRIDLDYNRKQNTGSHMMVSSGAGYVVGEGFNVSVKPEELIATKAADHIVRN